MKTKKSDPIMGDCDLRVAEKVECNRTDFIDFSYNYFSEKQLKGDE